MRVVGATRSFIRIPFFIEGSLIGLIGGLMAFALQMFLYNTFIRFAAPVMGSLSLAIAPFAEVGFLMFIVFCGAGLVAGALGSVLTIRRFLRV
jgi:cell division transport system permease protein